jgi:integrase
VRCTTPDTASTSPSRTARPTPRLVFVEAPDALPAKLKQEPWAEHGFVFCAENGEPLDQTNLYRRNFQRILRAAGLGEWTTEDETTEDDKGPRKFRSGFTMYSLRHSAASLALRNGVGVKQVSAMLGHASVVLTLDTYSHLIDGQQDEVAGVMQEALASVV